MVKTTQEYINGAAARFQADNANDDTVAAVFKWSTPAPNINGSVPKPWRVADKHAALTVMQSLGFGDARAEHVSSWRGREQLWVSTYQNGPTTALRDALSGAGYKVRWVEVARSLYLVDAVKQ